MTKAICLVGLVVLTACGPVSGHFSDDESVSVSGQLTGDADIQVESVSMPENVDEQGNRLDAGWGDDGTDGCEDGTCYDPTKDHETDAIRAQSSLPYTLLKSGGR